MKSLFNLTEGPETRITSDLVSKDILGMYFDSFAFAPNSKFSKGLPGFDLIKSNESLGKFKVTEVDCKGRMYYWKLQNKSKTFYFISKARMTGTWSRVKARDWICEVTLTNDNESKKLYFNDLRHYGDLEVLTQSEFKKQYDVYGFDPLIDDVDKYFPLVWKKSRGTKNCVSKFLLDHTSFYGIGLYLRSEILHSLKYYPYQNVNTFSKNQILDLMKTAVKIAKESYANNGCVKLKYNEETFGGDYLAKLKVFGKPRDVDGNKVIITIGKNDKRSMFWCRDIQVRNE